MKRFRLPKGAKAAIRAWLELPDFGSYKNSASFERHKKGACPFLGCHGSQCISVCAKMFPSVYTLVNCPCQALTLNYVIKRAKEIIR